MGLDIIIYIISVVLFVFFVVIVSRIWAKGKPSTYLNLFFALGLMYALWTLTNGTNVLLSPSQYEVFYPISLLTVCIIPSVMLRYLMYFTKNKFAASKVIKWIFTIIPIIDIILILTNPLHKQLIVSYNGLRPQGGSLFVFHSALAYIPLLIAIVILTVYIIKNVKKTPSLLFIAVGLMLPIVASLLYNINAFNNDFDFTPFTFLAMFLIFAIYSIKLRLFDVRGTAFTSLFVSLKDAFLVVDNDGIVADANPAFRETFPNFELIANQTPALDVLNYLELCAIEKNPSNVFESLKSISTGVHDAELSIVKEGKTYYYALSKAIIIERKQFAGYILTLTNINTYKEMIAEINQNNVKLIELKNIAETASNSKSEFLSRMSHEIRTPLNAIIGMTKIAESTNDVNKIKYCLATVDTSSEQLLGLINDILDLSKIEAGKFYLESEPINIEKILMKVCNLVVDKTEQKKQKFDIVMAKNMHMHYLGDELKISQIITNLLSNSVKFTPENGTITLTVNEKPKDDKYSILRISVSDTGIGMTQDQITKLFTSFEQADGSISRRFGGTGLGLAISKNLIEKMSGHVWVESHLNEGSVFTFEIELERLARQDKKVIFSGITPSDLKLLIVDSASEIRQQFISAVDSFGIQTHEASCGKDAVKLVEIAKQDKKPYDVIFLDYNLPDCDGIKTVTLLNKAIDKNTVIIMTTFNERYKIENTAANAGISRFITKPLFPSGILDAINDVVGCTLKNLNINSSKPAVIDLSNINIILAEDVEINREIFLALIEGTNINVDVAENGRIAVDKFKADPDKYDAIIMDVQMPEMNGYEATKEIRALNTLKAKSIPIIAMTANAFKEDIDKCIASGMNDHLSKPVDIDAVIEKISHFISR